MMYMPQWDMQFSLIDEPCEKFHWQKYENKINAGINTMLQAFQQWHAMIFQAKQKKIMKNLLHNELLRSQFEFL